MATLYYDTTLILSLALMLVYAGMWHKHFDVHITLTFVLVSVTNLGWAMLSRSQTLEDSLRKYSGKKLIFFQGVFLISQLFLGEMLFITNT